MVSVVALVFLVQEGNSRFVTAFVDAVQASGDDSVNPVLKLLLPLASSCCVYSWLLEEP